MNAAKATRMNISISDEVAGLLDKVENKSGYIARLVEEAWREWQEALRALDVAGWRSAEVRAACDVLNGTIWSVGESSGPMVAHRLEEATRLDGLAKKWELDGDHWRGIIEDLALRRELGFAVVVVVREWWRGNKALEAAIDRLDEVAERRARGEER